MEKSKKLLSLLLAVMMVCGLAVPAFAAGATAFSEPPANPARVSITPITYVCEGSDVHQNGTTIQPGTEITFIGNGLTVVGNPIPDASANATITFTKTSDSQKTVFHVAGNCVSGTNLGFTINYTDGANIYSQKVYTYVRAPQRNAHGLSARINGVAWDWCDNQTIHTLLGSEGTGGDKYIQKGAEKYLEITNASDLSGSTGAGKNAINSPVPLATYYIDKSIYSDVSEVIKVQSSLGRNTKDDNATSQIKIAAFGSRSFDSASYNGYTSPETGVYNLGKTIDGATDNVVRTISGPVMNTEFTVQMDTYEPSKHNSGTNYVQIDVRVYAIDKGNLRTLAGKIYDNYPQKIYYTTASYNNFESALANAMKVLNNNTELQVDIDLAYSKLNKAYNALEAKPADYTAVDAAVAAVPADVSMYTAESVQALNDAVNAVVRGKPIWEQADVDAMAANIRNAIDNLVLAMADYSEVDAAIAEARHIAKELYTEESVNNLQAVLDTVVRGLDITHQADVNAKAQEIRDAIAALVYLDADYSRIDELIAYTNTLTKSHYTNYRDVDLAIRAVKRGYDITRQAEVDAMADAIQTAIDNLVFRTASYTKVDNAVKDFEALNPSDYTTASYQALVDAVNAVVRDLDITRQAEVNAMADAINDAIAALQPAGNVELVATAGKGGVVDKTRDSVYGADNARGLVYGIEIDNGEDVYSCFEATNGGSINVVANAMGMETATGAVLQLIDTDGVTVIKEYTVVIFGDVNGNGYIDTDDSDAISNAANYLSEAIDGCSPEEFAGDINASGYLDTDDSDAISTAANFFSELSQAQVAQLFYVG